jgi:hypothetical protein
MFRTEHSRELAPVRVHVTSRLQTLGNCPQA